MAECVDGVEVTYGEEGHVIVGMRADGPEGPAQYFALTREQAFRVAILFLQAVEPRPWREKRKAGLEALQRERDQWKAAYQEVINGHS